MKKNKNFSELISSLEKIAEDLENEETPLENSFELYKAGMDVAKECYDRLKVIETDIKLVQDNGQQITETDYDREHQAEAVTEVVEKPVEKQEPEVKASMEEKVEKKHRVRKSEKIDRVEKSEPDISLPGLFSE